MTRGHDLRFIIGGHDLKTVPTMHTPFTRFTGRFLITIYNSPRYITRFHSL